MDTNDKPGISQAEHETAVKAAETKGHDAGVKATTAKFAAIVAAEGIKGNSGRMAAAIDLAVKSPAMSADDVTTFVSANIGAEQDKGGGSSKSLANRQASTDIDLTGSAQPDAGQVKKGWDAAFARTNAH